MKKVTVRSTTRREAGCAFPRARIERMNSNHSHSPERFPILTIFCLIFFGWQIAASALYFFWAGVPTWPAVALAMARFFVAVGLPESSLIPIFSGGKMSSAAEWTRAAGPANWQASTWLLIYIPIFSVFLTLLSIFGSRRWRSRQGEKVLRGVRVLRR